MPFYCYELYCADTHRQIVGKKPLDIKAEVRAALKGFWDEQILEPREDWFELLLSKICARTGFHVLDVDEICDTEELYWDEHMARLNEIEG